MERELSEGDNERILDFDNLKSELERPLDEFDDDEPDHESPFGQATYPGDEEPEDESSDDQPATPEMTNRNRHPSSPIQPSRRNNSQAHQLKAHRNRHLNQIRHHKPKPQVHKYLKLKPPTFKLPKPNQLTQPPAKSQSAPSRSQHQSSFWPTRFD